MQRELFIIGKSLITRFNTFHILVRKMAPLPPSYQILHNNFLSRKSLTLELHKMVKHPQTIPRLLATDCLSAFDHFVGLALKGLTLSCMMLKNGRTYLKDFSVITMCSSKLFKICYAFFKVMHDRVNLFYTFLGPVLTNY